MDDNKKEIIEEIGIGNVINNEKSVVEAGIVESQEDDSTKSKKEDQGFNKNFIKKFF